MTNPDLLLEGKMNHICKKTAWVMVLMLLVAAIGPHISGASMNLGTNVATAADLQDDNSMHRVRIILNKLRESLATMGDFDQLEQAGMRKADVDRLRAAMQSKIQMLQEEALLSIRQL
jgi:hypothetical protein